MHENHDNQAHLYMGCGITKDSNPRMEGERQQTMTMKRVL
jgi:isochorismate synthase